MTVNNQEFQLDGRGDLQKFLAEQNARLSPRALTLTLFMRLLVVDQFVHGIGGGRYDQVTNDVIEKFFRMPAPAFSVSTATLYFPAAVGRSRVCLSCIAQEGHRLRHGLLGKEKMELVAQIADSPRRSSQRQQVFSRMHQRMSSALAADTRVAKWQAHTEEANLRHSEEASLFDRELFYAIQPRDRLIALIEKYHDSIASA